MSLANKVHMPKLETRALIQANSFYEHNFDTQMIYNSPNSSLQNVTSLSPESPEKSFGLRKNFVSNSSSVTSTPSSTNSNNLAYNLSEDDHSMISFINANGSLHGFEQTKHVQRNLMSKLVDDDYPMWEDDLQPTTYHSPNSNAKYHGLPKTSGYGQPSDGVQFDWLNDQEGSAITDCIEEQKRHEASNSKRPLSTGESVQPLKKLCVGASSSGSKKPKSKSVSPCKDPQSSAAKNRRERISERLKTLQELVPNGSKVDLVTMLEKAIGYVQFLQLQVKVLATDEFWPAPGGKAPDLTQVKEAIDAILACQRGRNSSSTK